MSKQFKRFKDKVGKTALTIALVGVTTVGASAATNQATTTANLNMRTASNTNSKIVLTIPKGEKVNVIEEGKSWDKVEYKGKQGFAYKRYLKEVSTQVANVELKVNTKDSNLNVRTGPSTNYKIVGKLKPGATVKASEKTNGWYKINYNGQVAYISGDYVKVVNTDSNNGGSNNGGTSSTETPASGTMKNTASSLRIRKGASTSTSTIGYLDRNETVTVLAKTNNGWYKIKDRDGVVGYCSGKYLEVVNSNSGTETGTVTPMSGKVKVTAINLNVRTGAGTGHKVITTVTKDTVLEITGQHSNGWYQVKLADGRTGFVSNKYVSVVNEETKPEVKDEAPVITVAKETVTVEQTNGLSRGGYIGATASTFGAKATDKEDGDLTDKIELLGDNNLNTVGTRDLTLQVKDSAGNVTKKVVKLIVTEKEEVKPTPDPEPVLPPVGDGTQEDNMGVTPEVNEAPVINSVDSLTLEFGQAFDNSILKATATDKEDGTLEVKIEGTVDVNKAGNYTLTLTATDSKGLVTTKNVVVTVKEKVAIPEVNEAPTMTVAKTVVTITEGGSFGVNAFGAVATDKEDGNLAVNLVGNYDVNKVGTYNLQLVARDSKGLEVKKDVQLVVEARKNTAPTVTAKNVTINQGDNFSYDMLSAQANDVDGDKVTITYEGTVNTSKPGTYTIKVVATDDRGASSSINVTVTVKEVVVENTNPNDAEFKNMVLNQMVSLVNGFRAEKGVNALRVDTSLVGSANAWSKLMADKGVFDHVIEGKDVNAWFPEYGNMVGLENIAMNQLRMTGDKAQDAVNLANQLFAMWKGSQGHANSMKDEWSNLFGFGFNAVELSPGVYTIYATQHFSTDWDTLPMSVSELEKEEAEAPVVEEEVVAPEVEAEAPAVEEVTPEQPQVEEEVKEEQQPVVEMEDTVTEPTVEME